MDTDDPAGEQSQASQSVSNENSDAAKAADPKATAKAQGRKGGQQKKDNDEATKTKLILQNAQMIRQLQAAVMA